jgi:hypothetical protein
MLAGKGQGIVDLAGNASECLERASLFVAGAFPVVIVALILLSVVTRCV